MIAGMTATANLALCLVGLRGSGPLRRLRDGDDIRSPFRGGDEELVA